MSEPTVTETCKFPGCANAPEPASAKPGRPPEYCVDPAHNPVSAWRERKRLADAERGVATSEADVEQPVTMARVTGAEMLRQMRDLAGQLAGVTERLTGAVATLGDPGAAEAEVEAARGPLSSGPRPRNPPGPTPSCGPSCRPVPRHGRRGGRADERAPGRRAGPGAGS